MYGFIWVHQSLFNDDPVWIQSSGCLLFHIHIKNSYFWKLMTTYGHPNFWHILSNEHPQLCSNYIINNGKVTHTHTHTYTHKKKPTQRQRSIFICTSIWTCNTKHKCQQTAAQMKHIKFYSKHTVQSGAAHKSCVDTDRCLRYIFHCDIRGVGWTPIFQWLLAIIQIYLNLKTSPVSSIT